jgi:transcriptional regulator with XRE-family HTH domain
MWVAVAPALFTNMGHARRRPKRLAEKLVQIRKSLGVSQREMAQRLSMDVSANSISKYERDKNKPTLNVLLAYAHLGKVSMAQIVDDEEDLTLEL